MMNIEVVERPILRHKLTVSPSENRITIKLAAWCSDEEKERATEFLNKAAEYIMQLGVGLTLRGRLRPKDWAITLRSDSDRISVSFSVPVDQ